MLDVLEPLKVGHCHTSTVAEHIGEETDSLPEQDLLTGSGGWSVGCLDDQLALEPVCVVLIDGLLEGSRDEDVTRLTSLYHSW